MVKNLPTVERSTKIRFGKNVPDSDVQAENTIIINASNTLVTTPNSGSIYMSPVRFRDDFTDTNIVLMMYNRVTGEISESGESASNLVGGQTLQATTERGNTTTLTTRFTSPTTGIVTTGKVGVSNILPDHTLSVGSNVYIDDTGSNVLVVSGGVLLDGNLTVNGGVTSIVTENLKIKDAIIELGQNNTSGDTTLDLGLIMTRPQSNVTVGFLESSKEIVMGFTESSADSNVITPLVSEDINVHVYGRLYTEANVGVLNTNPMHTLDVGSNLYVDEFGSNILVVTGNTSMSGDLTVDTGTLHVDVRNKSIGLGTVVPNANLHVVGNVYVSSNLTVDTDTLHVDAGGKSIGLGTVNPQANLHVVGNVYVSSDLTVDTDTLHVDASGSKVGIKTKSPDAELHVVGNVYVSSNLSVDTDTLHVDAGSKSIGLGTVNPQANLHVVGNVYVSSDLTVDTDTFHVDATGNKVGIKTKSPDAELHVVGNAYVSSNLTVDTDTLHVDSVNKRVGIETKNPQANLHVVGNVYVSSNLTVDTDTFHVDSVNKRVGIETKNPQANLHVVGNVYVSSNLTVDTDTFHVDSVNKRVGIETKNPTSNLHVVGNAYVTSNTTTDGTLTLNHPTTALITDLTANVEVKLNQLANVVIGGKALANEDMLVYDGSNWTNQLQNHTFLYAKAEETISKGDAVYATGTIGNNTFIIRKAQANSSTTMPALGLAYQDFALNDQGLIVTFGRADGINTGNFQTGETVYVSNVTAGELSNVKPYGSGDLIQNIGLVVKGHPSTGIVSVTGVGRSNDIPNAPIVADEGDINYVYVNDANNDLKKILPTNLLTQLQTLQQVTDTGNTSSNVVQFTNATTGLVTTSNLQIGSNISVAGLKDPTNKYLPMVNHDGFFQRSPVYVTDGGKYVISASEAEFLGNITLSGNTTIISSNNVTIEDRIFGIGANNSTSGLDSGIIIEHQDEGTFANVALIHHADEHSFSIGYTQNTYTDDHILDFTDATHILRIRLRGNVEVQNNITVTETLNVTGATTFGDDLTVGGASNLFVDVSASRVGINEASPTTTLDVNGDARVQDTTDAASTTTGALVVSGGLGVVSNIHSTNVYAGSHVGVGTNAASAPVHILVSGTGETTNGIYMKSAAGSSTNDAIVNLEVASDGGDAFMTWNASGGAAFAMGLDRSESLLTIANSSSSLNTNSRLRMATDGAVTLTNATNATSKTTGSLILGGGLGVTGDIHATHANLEDVEADSIDVTDTTAATNKTTGALTVAGGVGISGATFGAAATFDGVTSVTNATAATGKTDGALVVTGGVGISGATFGAAATFDGVTSVTNATAATGKTDGALVVTGGVGISGATFGAAATFDGVTSVTNATAATGKTDGALVVTGGVGISGATFGAAATFDGVTSVTDATAATGKTDGALVVTGGVGISGATFGAAATFDGVTSVTNATAATGKTDGALVVTGGVGISGALFGSTADLDGVVTLTDTTEATSSTTGALKAAGGVGIAKDVYVGERAYVTGGLITNTGGVTKKTYSFTGALDSGQTIADSTIKITFSAHVFYAKIVAHLIESDDEVSTLSMECGGGHRTGGTPLTIAKGPTSVFGSASTNPWNSAVAATTTTVALAPTTDMAAAGNYNIFIEYISAHADGAVTKITEGSTDVITFGY